MDCGTDKCESENALINLAQGAQNIFDKNS